jgi:hypothetical protein
MATNLNQATPVAMDSEFDWLRSHFPKKRPALPAAYRALYENEYKRNRGSHNTTPDFKQKLENWMHRQVAHPKNPGGAILEIGAGTLNHVNFEREDCPYDIVEPFATLYQDQPVRSRLREIYKDIGEIPTTESYAKILSVAVLEHIEDLPHLVSRSALLLHDDGVMAHGIPSEGGLLWYLGWRFGTGLSFRVRSGLPYAPLMRHEHVNGADEIMNVLKVFFGEISYSRFPLPFLHGSFYTCVTLRKPNKIKAALFLRGGA